MSNSALTGAVGLRLGLGVWLGWTLVVWPWQVPRSLAAPRPEANLQPDRSSDQAGIPSVRVLLTTRAVTSLPVRVDGPYRVQSPDGRVLAQGSRFDGVVSVEGGGLRFGQERLPTQRMEIVPETEPSLWVDDRQYRGRLRVLGRSGQQLIAANVVDLESYVASVLNSEMPGDFPLAARRSQAIAARTYALYQMKSFGQTADYDLADSTQSQLYLGVQYRHKDGRRLAVENAASRQIAQETRGIVSTYRGRLFCTYYSAICGGRTTDGRSIFPDAAAPLASVPCDWCAEGKYYRWQAEMPRTQVEEGLGRYWASQGQRLGNLRDLDVAPPPQTGWVPMVRVVGTGGAFRMSAHIFRLQVGPSLVRSPYFQIEPRGPDWFFSGRGWGHGVGLCQWGARGQALAGRTTRQILQYYYPDSQLVAVQ